MLWTRESLKLGAKEQLRGYYWMAFAVSLVYSLITSVGGSFSSSMSYQGPVGSLSALRDGEPGLAVLMGVISMLSFLLLLLGIAITVFALNPLKVGLATWFIAAPRGYQDFGLLFSSFRQGRYKEIVRTMFFVDLEVWLWTLLFIVPGIIKGYEYRMVPYLISDHPYLTPQEAKEISRVMTAGQKLDMWVLDLSFIGWYLLTIFTLFLGMYFLEPYVQATWAQLYFVLRQRVAIPPPPPQPGWGYQGQ